METTNTEILNQLIVFAANRRTCAVHFVRHDKPGITVGRIDGVDARMVFVATRSQTSAVPLAAIASVLGIGGGA
jgi:ABC-type thiamin/hydroxymethylpyrimidine transport system permease subunit